ncbi:TrbI/VirB10 family protein [Nostoc sp. UIC 10890]
MTRYSIPAETPPQNGFTLTTDDRQPEVESLDWESRMSRLVGFEEESSSTDTQGLEDSATPPESLSLPQEVQTKQALSSNPFAKLGLVGAATLAIVLVGGVFLSQLMGSSSQKPKNIVSPPVREQPTDESISQQLAAEVDTLKTKLALTEQAQMVKAAQQQLRIAKTTPKVALQEPSVSSRGRQTVIPTPPPTAYVPQPAPVERIVRVPAYQPSVSPQLPAVTAVRPTTQPVVNITPPPPPSPLEEWTRLAKLGSYGQVNATDQPSNIAAAPEPVNNTQPEEQTPNPNPEQTPQPETPVVSQAQPQGQKSVPIGSSAKGVLATAIFGETTRSGGGGEGGEDKNVFVIRLKEPLKSTDGAIALPANTELLAEIRSLSEQGLLQMNVVKVISQNDGNVTERSLPNNAIILRASQGKPLIANKFPGQSSSIASMDIGLFVLGGIGKAAELINRSDTELQPLTSQTTVDGNTSSSTTLTTVTKNRRDLTAGVVEGGLNSVVPQIAQRNQQAIAQMSQQTNIWFLPAGTNVEIYVNQPTQF